MSVQFTDIFMHLHVMNSKTIFLLWKVIKYRKYVFDVGFVMVSKKLLAVSFVIFINIFWVWSSWNKTIKEFVKS